ncbi:unnamed protein product, partial [Rotaria sp. Silwood1]
MLNPQNLLTITVLIPQQIAVQQLGNSQDLSMNLRRHIIRFPVYTDQLTTMSNPFVQQQQQIRPSQSMSPTQQQIFSYATTTKPTYSTTNGTCSTT